MNPSEELKKIAQELEKTQKKAQQHPEPDDFKSFADFEQYLNKLGVQKIVDIMNDYPPPMWWFPSQWGSTPWGKPYPKILAQALVRSNENESITDLSNIYYAGRSISKEAEEIFKQDVLNKSKYFANLIVDPGLSSSYDSIFKYYPEIAKALVRAMSNKEVAKHIDDIQALFSPTDAADYFKLVDIDLEDYA